MRVACPSCSTIYEVPDHVLGTGMRKLRCARCGTEWTSSPQFAEPAADAPPAEAALSLPRYQESTEPEPPPAASPADASPALAIPEPSIVRDRSRHTWPPPEAPPATDFAAERRPATPAAIWLAWAVTIVVIALLVWGGYNFRAEVMHFWPASQRLYALIGIGPDAAPAPR